MRICRTMSSRTSGRRGGRERHHRRAAQALGDPAQHHVVGAEVVPPLAHAVRLVDHEQRHPPLQEELEEVAVAEALGRHVQDLPLAPGHRRLGLALLARAERRVDGPRVHPQLVQLVGLVLHQRDEGGDDHGEAGKDERGELVEERLAGAGGHHHQRVAAAQHRADHLLLPGAELVEREGGAQDFEEIGAGGAVCDGRAQACSVVRVPGGADPSGGSKGRTTRATSIDARHRTPT
jgi:hypothetical protein